MDSSVPPQGENEVHQLARVLHRSQTDDPAPLNRCLVREVIPGLVRMIERVDVGPDDVSMNDARRADSGSVN